MCQALCCWMHSSAFSQSFLERWCCYSIFQVKETGSKWFCSRSRGQYGYTWVRSYLHSLFFLWPVPAPCDPGTWEASSFASHLMSRRNLTYVSTFQVKGHLVLLKAFRSILGQNQKILTYFESKSVSCNFHPAFGHGFNSEVIENSSLFTWEPFWPPWSIGGGPGKRQKPHSNFNRECFI